MKALIILSAIMAGSAASAQPVTIVGEITRTERVGYADLDLTTDAGVHRLQDRVRFAASKLCIESGVQSLPAKIAGKQCFNAAYADALDQVANVVEARRASLAALGSSIRVQSK
jgi:UrcA family protein